jgi:hypothetical protein
MTSETRKPSTYYYYNTKSIKGGALRHDYPLNSHAYLAITCAEVQMETCSANQCKNNLIF